MTVLFWLPRPFVAMRLLLSNCVRGWLGYHQSDEALRRRM